MQDDYFKRRDGEDVIDSLPLQLAEEQLCLVDFAGVEHERGQQGHAEEDGFEVGGLGFEAVEDDGQGEQAGDLQSKSHDKDLGS